MHKRETCRLLHQVLPETEAMRAAGEDPWRLLEALVGMQVPRQVSLNVLMPPEVVGGFDDNEEICSRSRRRSLPLFTASDGPKCTICDRENRMKQIEPRLVRRCQDGVRYQPQKQPQTSQPILSKLRQVHIT